MGMANAEALALSYWLVLMSTAYFDFYSGRF
jgi:hypothetical protein